MSTQAGIFIAIISVLITLIMNVAYGYKWSGRQEQMAKDGKDQFQEHKANTAAAFVTVRATIDELYTLNRQHEASDQNHFKDGNLHWGTQERFWLNERFKEMESRFEKRFDKIDARLETLSEDIKENNK